MRVFEGTYYLSLPGIVPREDLLVKGHNMGSKSPFLLSLFFTLISYSSKPFLNVYT